MGLSSYGKGQFLNHLLRAGTFAKPTGIWVALFKADGTEMSGGGYARVQHGPGDAFWRDQVSGNGISSNIGPIAFPTPTGADWGQAASFRIYDDATAGNELGAGVLQAPKTINVGDPAPTFPDGALVTSFT